MIDISADPIPPIVTLIPPVAVNDAGSTKENTPVVIDVTSNDTNKDSVIDPSTVTR